MTHLLEVTAEALETLTGPLDLEVGDLVRVAAGGGWVLGATGPVDVQVCSTAVLATDGSVLTPLGPPNVVLLHARRSGSATVVVSAGDPFHGSRPVTVEIVVRDPS